MSLSEYKITKRSGDVVMIDLTKAKVIETDGNKIIIGGRFISFEDQTEALDVCNKIFMFKESERDKDREMKYKRNLSRLGISTDSRPIINHSEFKTEPIDPAGMVIVENVGCHKDGLSLKQGIGIIIISSLVMAGILGIIIMSTP